jgi:hypothetical protein
MLNMLLAVQLNFLPIVILSKTYKINLITAENVFVIVLYKRNFGAFETDAIITSVKKNGVSVIIPRYGIEGKEKFD